MTAIKKPNSFAKNMESNTKRLIQKTHPQNDTTLSQRKVRRSSFSTLQESSRFEKDVVSTNHTSPAISPTTRATFTFRLHGEMRYEHAAANKVNNRNSWKSPIGTIADHRMTNNNRIRKQWHIFAVMLMSLILCLVQVTVVNGHPDPVPTPVRVSHSYTKTVSNTIPTSTTSRSTTQLTSFLPSDAISSLSASVINYKNFNTFASNRSSSSGSRINSSIFSFKPNNVSTAGSKSQAINNNSNANISSSSRRSTPVKANRKDFSSQTTSIDRPFYTKLTSNDAVATPTHYKRTKSVRTKKTKKSKNSSRTPSSFGKFSKTKGSKEHASSSSSSSVEEIDNDEYAFMPQTTEKSYHPPKLSLEPFFNFLTSLATASREVMMSKEQYHPNNNNNNHHQTELSSSTTGGSSKYSPSYETINQSMREGAKKSKKSKKGKGKKKSKGHLKGSKKGSKGGGKRHRIKSIESLSLEDEEFELDPVSHEEIAMSLPNPIIDSAEDEKENDNDSPLVDGIESPGGFHILDVLRTPMIADYESPYQAARAEPLVGLDYPEGSNNNDGESNNSHKNDKNVSFNTSSSSFSSNPTSARANLNKGQGYIAFDNYEGPGTKNMSSNSMMKQKSQQDKQLSERDPMDSFNGHQKQQQPGGGVDLTAQESISHAQVVPSPFGMKTNAGGGLAPSQYHQYQQQQQQNPKGNNNELSHSPASSQQVFQPNSPEYAQAVKNVAGSVETNNAFRQQQTLSNGKNDFVSKYPTTFVYQPQSGPQGLGSRPNNMNPSPPGMPPMNAMIYGSPPPSSRPPFRMNKLRPNLHSYYDSSYHNYAGLGESQVASEMIGIRHPYGPPHFKPPPPRVMHHPHPLPSPPRFVNGYGNRPGLMAMPHSGTHYVGHTFNNAAPPTREPNTKPYDGPNTDYQQDLTGNGNNNIENSSDGNQDIGGSDVVGSGDNIDQYTVSEIDDDSVTASENSETKKVGIMDSFDLFYKEYKILTWVAVFFCTSMALLTLLVYLYINNPPTEVVHARQLFPWTDLLRNPQITRFLSNLTETSVGNRKRKKDNPVDDDYDEMGYLKPYGKGFGGKSGRQKRKQTRSQQDRTKLLLRRASKIKRLNESGSSNSTIVATLISSNSNKLANRRNANYSNVSLLTEKEHS